MSESTQEITAGNRLAPMTSEEWNRQTTVDARNVLQTQLSQDVGPFVHEQRAETSEIPYSTHALPDRVPVLRPPSYPNHVLHPEVIPSLNDVPAELEKRRHARLMTSLILDEDELDADANATQEEFQRAVQNQFSLVFSSFSSSEYVLSMTRAALDRNTDTEQHVDAITSHIDDLFQAVHVPSEAYPTREQPSLLSRSSSAYRTNEPESFQRIKIAGDIEDMLNIEDLQDVVSPLLRALIIRERSATPSYSPLRRLISLQVHGIQSSIVSVDRG